MRQWADSTAGLVRLPSGTLVRGRSLRAGAPADAATVTLALTWLPPESAPGRILWVRTPDFGVPLAPGAARRRIAQAHELLSTERVEVVCGGGIGRTGTGLAALAILDGLSPADAVEFVRAEYHPRAVETPWQRWFLRTFRR
ncbi:Dual specificity protein phosphatase OS=Tsukamurella paurometabola (strain ATCC 8368 / DSM /CCUG 35730 / CIP 100753 / JCM 10117 / KCTC 9821 / NBRC 16120/ NCIMB 702349 / NCTC 13040) OX=521096 GN=Tpau_0391 PE=4 SV=1 [Tsukamurella paurometabola]|uniref:Dual specificity protein phosphatase n=1 Tax=Tsukamurella paurometabola (strain ATCC 8368 / DSM 20162 / CCUG 35730 / CIP 100753 / JCM 10117 / KCTC 9821 / NBRC 16120 / NCIMB 702349 / NCTC 13040) TaxID=521096 RepID=D5URH9_TSUPD|nr:hypothetical protein [Tsukamurella paurometabola]ADG77032.1 dual specificity protein phosphatase [Tsukamurella paurometabola DSM 20162]SUP42536.1 Uncharacterised protein [Tsukamurella paurometabola]